ncbi:MAG: InlB B-repeat-containing protein, partial [Clostridia bacterium]|nr:InlB B-repeat-containing protein [Clostridia bacterium]
VTVSFATETAEVQSTNAEYYIGSDSLDSGYSVEYGESTYQKLYYGDGAATLTEQVSSLEEANRPENKILIGWKLWGMHYYGELHSGPIEKSLTDVVTAKDIEKCFEGDGCDDGDNYYNPLVEPHYVDKYIIDPQPTNETFTVGGKEYNIDDGEYYDTTDVTYQWHLWETVPYTVVSTVEDETTEIAKSYIWKLTFSEGKWLTTANSTYSQISIAAQAGDTIDIKFDSDFSGSVRAYYSSGDYEYNSETQSYRYTMSEDGDAYAYIRPEDTSIQHTFTMSVLRNSVGESVAGETEATLTSGEDGNSYLCQLTFGQSDDAVVLYSDAVVWDEPEILHEHPICGDTECTSHGSGVTYTAWDGTTAFPGGNVYLSNDITLEETLEISSGTVNLCLNGNDILSDNTAIKVTEGAILNICDCSSDKTGTIKSGYYGIYNVGGAVNIYGGKVSGTSVSTVYISGGTLNLRGGRLESISAENNATALYITSSASVEISGGEIYAEGGSDRDVCGVLIADSNSSTTISGGTISAGCTNTTSSSRSYTVAAVKHLSGKLSVIGGTLTTDTADNCSAGYVAALYDNRQSNDETSTITISGGTFELKKSKGSQIIGAIITDWSEMPINLSGDLVITAESAPDFAIDPSTPLSFTSEGLNEPEEPYTVAKQNRSSADYPWKFTTGWSQTGISDTDIGKYFVAYGDNYRVTKADNGELQLSETYTISFDAYPATSPDSQKLLYGEKVTKPTTPVREGYGLSHWCTDSSCTNGTTCENAWDFDTDTVTKGDTLYAVWESTHWRVTLRAQGGECDDDYSYVDKITGKLESLPTATRVGYTFNGWFDASEGGNKITTETEFTGDTRIYAQWTAYEITQQPTVDNEYEVKVNPSANVAYTWHEMTETAVTAENAGIYEDEGYSSSYTAEWWSCHSTEGMGTPGYFSIDLNAGDVVEVELSRACTGTVRIQHYYYDGANVTRYQAYKDTGGGNKASLVAPAAANYELFVSVHDDGEQPTLKAKVIKAGEAISGQTTNKLTDGTDGMNYVAKITYPDSAVLTSEAVCYVSPSFEVTFDTNGGTNVSKQKVDNGGKVEEPATPTKTGYTFAGWYKDSELETA